VPRTAAYVDQNSNHIAELTVRETLDFAQRVQSVDYSAPSALTLNFAVTLIMKATLTLNPYSKAKITTTTRIAYLGHGPVQTPRTRKQR